MLLGATPVNHCTNGRAVWRFRSRRWAAYPPSTRTFWENACARMRATGDAYRRPVPLRGNLDVLHLTRRSRDRQAARAKALDVKDDCLAYRCFDFSNCGARRDTARKVWHICRVVALGPLNDHGVAHGTSLETNLLQGAVQRTGCARLRYATYASGTRISTDSNGTDTLPSSKRSTRPSSPRRDTSVWTFE